MLYNKEDLDSVYSKIAADAMYDKIAAEVSDGSGAEDTESGSIDLRQAGGPPAIKKYYFYEISKDNKIDFTSIVADLKDDPVGMSKKLTTGYAAHRGDHFMWDSVIVKTNFFEGSTHGRSFVVYKADLSPDGSRVAGQEKIYMDSSLESDPRYKNHKLEVTDDFLKDNNIFESKEGVSELIKLDTDSATSAYIDRKPTSADLKNILLSGIKGLTYDQWKEQTFFYYRLWSPNSGTGELRMPDLSAVPQGQYNGTPQAMAQLIKASGVDIKNPTPNNVEPKDNKNNLDTKNEQARQEQSDQDSPFRPVDSDKGEGKEASTSGSSGKGPRDYSDSPYGGGFNIMQNLVKDQKKSMALREAAQRVVLSSFSSTGFGGSSSGGESGLKNTKKLVDETNKSAERLKKNLQSLTGADDEDVKEIEDE